VRFLNRAQYKALSYTGTSFKGKSCWIQFRIGSTNAKLGITVTKRFGKAHDRNRFKRIAREAFRDIYSELPPGLEMQISPRFHAKNIKPIDIQKDIRTLKNGFNLH